MHVRIKKAGNNGPPSEVDRLRTGTERHRLTDIHDACVLDRER
jgi:hypothetical protein